MAKRGHLVLTSTLLNELSESAYRDYVLGRLEQLNQIFALSAIGDFSRNVEIPSMEDDFAELYVGVQVMIEVIREKIAELDAANARLRETVTERTSQLGRSQSYLQSVVENAPNYIQMLDLNLRYTFINRTAPGVNLGSYIGKEFGSSISDKKEVARVQTIMRSVLNDRKTRHYEYHASLNGETRWYKSNVGPIVDNGEVTGLVAITFDITAEKRSNEELNQQKIALELARQRDRAMLNSIGEGLLMIDKQGRIANVNDLASEMLGYERKDLMGKWFSSTVLEYSEEGSPIEALDRPAMKSLASGKSVTTRARYMRRDGTTFPVSLTVSPVIFEGKPIGVIEVFRDITTEAELDQTKQEFVSLASHQLRTPATGVKAYLSMMLDGYTGDLSSDQREFLQKIFDSNERQLEIINNILDAARLDAGRIIPEMTTVSMNELIKSAVEELRPLIQERDQKLIVDLPDKVVEAVADRRLIYMVVENIISNASKYTLEQGQLEVSLRSREGTAIITVKDTGVGIAPENQPRLFQRFSRIPNVLSTARGGTGLGLYLASHIVQLHHGSIGCNSELGKGTVFDIEIPLRPPQKKKKKKNESTS